MGRKMIRVSVANASKHGQHLFDLFGSSTEGQRYKD